MPLEFTLGNGTRHDVEELVGCALLEDLQRWQAWVRLRIKFGVPHQEIGRSVNLVITSLDSYGTPQQLYRYQCGDRQLLIHTWFDTELQDPFQP